MMWPICATCGSRLKGEAATYCTECKTYTNSIRQFFSNFNASGWTAFLAVGTLTLASVDQIRARWTDDIGVYPSLCRSHQMIVAVANGEGSPMILSDGDAKLPGQHAPATFRLVSDSTKFPDVNQDHIDSIILGPGSNSYVSISIPNLDIPDEAAVGQCKIDVNMNYSLRGEKKNSIHAGQCGCEILTN